MAVPVQMEMIPTYVPVWTASLAPFVNIKLVLVWLIYVKMEAPVSVILAVTLVCE